MRAEQLELLMPYGLGLRRCGGEGLARKEIFQFVVSIVHRYIMHVPTGALLSSCKMNLAALQAQYSTHRTTS